MASANNYRLGRSINRPPPRDRSVMTINFDDYAFKVVKSENTSPPVKDSDALPTNESFYGRLKAAKRESSGFLPFLNYVLVIIMTKSVVVTLFVINALAIPTSMTVIGAIYKDDCPAEKLIPIYLIVAGSLSLAKDLAKLAWRFYNRKTAAEGNQTKRNPLETILDCFMVGLFIGGSVNIYRTKGTISDNPNDDNYCNSTLYWFSFWFFTSHYIILALLCICILLIYIAYRCMKN